MPRADGTLNAREKAADIWQQQHWVDADGDPAINRVQSYPGTYVREPSAMLRGNFSLSSFGTPEEVIWWAAHENECDILMSLALDRRLDINWRNEHGCSAFYIAVVKGHIDAVQTLLQINRDDFDYDLVCPRALDASPFWAAARRGDAAMIKVLLEESPCDFEKANKHGITPVAAAREAGHDDVVLLIERRKRKLAGVADWPSYKPPSREKGRSPVRTALLNREKGHRIGRVGETWRPKYSKTSSNTVKIDAAATGHSTAPPRHSTSEAHLAPRAVHRGPRMCHGFL